jgi:hypothetical protein
MRCAHENARIDDPQATIDEIPLTGTPPEADGDRKRIVPEISRNRGLGSYKNGRGSSPSVGRGLAGGHEIARCIADLDEEVADPAGAVDKLRLGHQDIAVPGGFHVGDADVEGDLDFPAGVRGDLEGLVDEREDGPAVAAAVDVVVSLRKGHPDQRVAALDLHEFEPQHLRIGLALHPLAQGFEDLFAHFSLL